MRFSNNMKALGSVLPFLSLLVSPVAAQWPANATVFASSTLSGSSAQAVIDKNLTSYWTDNTPGAFPDSLGISFTTPLDLAAVFVTSPHDGYIVDYDVYVGDSSSASSATTLAASMRSLESWATLALFNTTFKGAQYVKISVLNSQNSTSRISEIQPVTVEALADSNSTSSTASVANSTTVATQSSDAFTTAASSKTSLLTATLMVGLLFSCL